MRQGDRHDRHDHEYRQKRAAQKRRPPDQVLHVLGRSLEAEAEGRSQDAQLKGPGDEVLKHGSSLRNATSLGRAASGAARLKRTRPTATGSKPTWKTIGMALVAALAASAPGVPPNETITLTLTLHPAVFKTKF